MATTLSSSALPQSPDVPSILRVAFQGEPGAYSEQAIRQLLGTSVTTVPCPDFASVHQALLEGHADRIMLPVENSLAGTANLHDNWEFLALPHVHTIAETILRVRHCAISLPGTLPQNVREVRSHPQALAQCRQNLSERFPNAVSVPALDTAGSARILSETREAGVVAIASRLAAQTYGLEILHEGLEDDASNYTRFLLASLEPVVYPEPTALKTSLAFTLDHAGPGSLFRALGCFALRDLDLARIESRPIPGSPWRYRFFIDIHAGANEVRCARALEHLSELVTEMAVVGSYPAWPQEENS